MDIIDLIFSFKKESRREKYQFVIEEKFNDFVNVFNYNSKYHDFIFYIVK